MRDILKSSLWVWQRCCADIYGCLRRPPILARQEVLRIFHSREEILGRSCKERSPACIRGRLHACRKTMYLGRSGGLPGGGQAAHLQKGQDLAQVQQVSSEHLQELRERDLAARLCQAQLRLDGGQPTWRNAMSVQLPCLHVQSSMLSRRSNVRLCTQEHITSWGALLRAPSVC